MDLNGCLTLIVILALTVGLVVFRQLTKWQRRGDSESTSTSTGVASALDGLSLGQLRRHSESTSRTDHASGEENEGSDVTNQMKRKRSSEAIRSMETKTAYEYDVFLSFCGDDTRLNFTDNLYHRMKNAGICVFLDSEELKNGKRIDELLKALDESRIYMPIFSQQFASRKWCLREIVRMVDRHLESDGKREIIPIFYDVEPNDVKLVTDLYNIDLLKHKSKEHRDSEEVDQWTIALKEVGSMMGRVLKGKREGEEIESIVKEVLAKLGKHVDVPGELVEDYRQIQAIIEMLDLKSGGVRFVGIHGIGGIGKTTLAKVVFKKLCPHFDRVCFLNDVRKSSEHGVDGLVTLQKKLLTSVGNSSQADHIKDIGDGMYWIEAVCKNKKVFIVLDDLDNDDQLKKLAGKSDWFGSGSRIIITTRNNCLLKIQGESSSKEVPNQTKEIVDYEVHEMEINQALQLFYKHAFRSDSPIEGYAAVSKDIVEKVAMLPLAVVVVGSFLFRKGVALGRHGNKRNLWEQTLKKLDRGPFKDVRDALMISYEGLEDVEKDVFLDIACFFTNEDQTYPIIMWDDCKYYPDIAIAVLLEQSLIKIGDDNTFWMHDQIRDLGRYIILEGYSCKEHPPKVSRVWTHEDAVKLLEGKERNKHVEALSVTSSGYGCNFAAQELACLPHLRFLRVKGIDFSGNFDNLLSKLRWLSWQTCQMIFNANDVHFNNLVVLNLSNSDIQGDWHGWSKLKMTKKLKVLDLTDCTKLRRTPDFSNFTSLETLVLARCSNLITIHPSISKLQLLETLNIKGCSSLGELPEEICSLLSLKQIIMPQNFQPLKLPERFGNLKSLSSFRLSCHPKICKLPDSIGGAVNLTCLTLRDCVGIKELPSSIGELPMLVELDISSSGIVELPHSIGNLKKLKVLSLCRTKIKEIPRTIGGLEMLEGLYAHQSWDLTDKNLEEIGKLRHLKTLNLAFTSISRFPAEISCLHLQKLEMGSIELQQVSALPSSLKFLAVQALDFSLIPDPSSITGLEHLELQRFSNSTNIPRSTWQDYHSKIEAASMREQPSYQLPSHLSTLKLRGISPLPHFSNLSKLTVLHVIDCAISHLPIDLGLTHLRELFIRRCKSLEKIPGLSLLRSLERLELEGLNRLVEIQGLSELESLQYFRISSCDLIRQLPNFSKLGKLQHLELEACPNLRAIEGIEGLESWELDTCGHTILERLLNISRSSWLSHRLSMYDVFLSSKGADTHRSIVSYLHDWMFHNQISVYSSLDDYRSKEGIGEKILQALANSNIYIPVFSRNYASSHWCLRELAHMVKCTLESKGKRRILPIFYDVETDDVNLETDLYNSALRKHWTNFDHNEVKSWKDALIEAAAMRGFVLKNNSYEEVLQEIVAEVFRARKLLNVDS